MRKTFYLAAAACSALACGDPLEPTGGSTTISGTVYRAGSPVAGVMVTFSQDGAPGGPCCLSASGVTDSNGRYTLRPDPGHRPGAAPCDLNARYLVVIGAESRAEHRLYSARSRIERAVTCGQAQDGVDFSFGRDLWYSGVSQTLDGTPAPDSVAIAPGDGFRLVPSFTVREAFEAGYTHADDYEWVWGGQSAFDWRFDEVVIADRTDYGHEYYVTGGGYVDLEAMAPGVTLVVTTLAGSPLSDTMVVVVREPVPTWGAPLFQRPVRIPVSRPRVSAPARPVQEKRLVRSLRAARRPRDGTGEAIRPAHGRGRPGPPAGSGYLPRAPGAQRRG